MTYQIPKLCIFNIICRMDMNSSNIWFKIGKFLMHHNHVIWCTRVKIARGTRKGATKAHCESAQYIV